MPSRSARLLLSLFVLIFVAPALFAHDVTITGTQSFASLDGSASDHDGAANGVFTVNDGNLVVNGTVNCNDDGQAGNSACAMSFAVSGNMTVGAGGALYAENRSGSGNGGAITLTVGGNLALTGSAIVSSASTSNAGNANGGSIHATVSGSVSVGAGSSIDSGSAGAVAGNVTVAAGGVVAIDGNVVAGPSRTVAATRLTGVALTGGGGNQRGGQISITSTTFVEPALVVGPTANVVSQGETATGSVTLDGCGVDVRGLVASLSRSSAAIVTIRSGKSAVIDGRDLGAAGIRMGRVRADSTHGTASANRVDVFASDAISIHGPASGLFAVTSNTGTNDPKGDGGSVRVIALAGSATAGGNAIDAGGSSTGNGGGSIAVDAAGDALLNTATLRAAGDHTSNNNNRNGGTIRIRSYAGNVLWTNGVGDVRPLGSASNLPLADQGSIVLTACGTVNTTGSSFPVNGTATSVHPQTQTGVCSPSGPSLPAGTPPLVTCNTPPVANDTAAITNEDTTVTVTLSGTDADGDPLTFSIVSGPSSGALGPVVSTGPTTATVNYTPNLNFNGSDSFVYQANDGNGGTDTANAAITVNPVNDPPSFLAGPTVTVLEDSGAKTIANWATAISPGPADESGQTVTFTVTNDNPSLFSVQPSLSSNGTLTFTPAANAYGSATITVTAKDNGGTLNGGNDTSASQSSTITVTPVNDAPSFVKGADQTVNEDAGPQSVAGWATAIFAGPNEGSQTVSFVTSNTDNALFSSQPAVSSSGTLTYTPAANANGSATVTIYAQDDGGTANGGVDSSAPQTFTITVNAVNDPPSFTGGGDVNMLEDSGSYSAAWATAISAGPADESGQTVSFTATNDNNALFSVQPSIDPSGVLTFTVAANAFGSATVTVTLSDNGGGANTSAPQTFTINVANVNDEPTFTAGGNVIVNEDSGAYSAAWATGISAGPNEGSQTLTFNVTSDNNALFSVQPSISASGVLSFATATNAFGTASVSVTLTDNGGTANGGADTSSTVTFTITINPVNDAPSFTGGGNVTVSEDSGAYSAAWATAISAGPANESSQTVTFVSTNTNNALFSVQPSVSPSGVLSFTVAANATGSATVTIYAQDNGGTANGGVDVSASQTFTISVNGINDPPSFTPGANQTSNEDAGPQTVAGWATAISPGPADESGQTVTFFTSNDNTALFSVQPSVAPDGTLTYTASPNANGTATVTIYAQDNGGTANGGNNTSATYTFSITIVAVNDPPSFTGGGNVSVLEDSVPYSAAWATAISAGPADEAGQSLTFNVTGNSNPSLFASGPSISASGVLSFTLNANAFGSANITVTLSDNGGTANGGVDTSASQSFTITVNAVNDAPSFVGGGNVTVNEDSGLYSQPWATSISAGPNESGQTVTFNTSNSNNSLFLIQPAISSTGQLTFTTAPNAFGSATVTVTLSDNGGTANGGVDTSAPQTFTINVTALNDGPTATADSWETLGNTEIRVDLPGGLTPHVSDTTPSGNGVRDNDTDPEGDPTIVTGVVGCGDTTAPFDCTLGSGAKVSMLANGSFSYTPAPGTASGSFQYTATDVPSAGSPVTTTGTVNITIHDMIWYVNGAAAPGGNGTSSSPFTNFASLNGGVDVDSTGQTIFVHTSAVAGSISLEAGQKLYGQGVGLSKPNNLNGNGSPIVLVAAGVNPTVTSATDVVSVLGVAGVEIAGLTLNSTGGNGIDVTSTPFGTAAGVAIYSNTIAGAGMEGIDVSAGSPSTNVITINNTSITSTGNGLDVSSFGTTEIAYTNGTIASSAGSGISMNGSTRNLTVTGLANVTIDGNTAADGIRIVNATFDAVGGGSFNTVNTGSMTVGSNANPVGANGVVLNNVSGDLHLGALNVHGSTSGVVVTGSALYTAAAGMRIGNTGGAISAAAGVGLSVTNASIAAGNLNFTSINAAGGANGILLSNTDSVGGVTVSGNGSTAGSGGTIQNTSSDAVRIADGSNVSLNFMNITNAASGVTNSAACTLNNAAGCESAVDMLNATNVTLNNVVIDHNGAGQTGISGVNTNGLTVTDSQILEVGNANEESAVLLHNTSGTVLFEDVMIDNPEEYGVRVFNTTGVLAMTLRRVTVQNNIGSFGEAGASFRIEGGTATAHIDDSDFLNTDGPAVDGQAAGLTGAVLNMTITGSTMNENRALPHGINFTTAGTAAGRLTANGNNLTGCAVATNCSLGIDLDAANTSTLDATVTNNVITSTGVGGGIEFIVNDNSVGRAEIRDNGITVSPNRIGMNFLARSVLVPGSNGQLHLTVEGNTVNGTNSATGPGMAFAAGASTGTHAHTVCANVSALTSAGGNIVNGTSGPGVFAYTLRQRTGTTFRLTGFSGTGTLDTSVESHVQSNNPGGTLAGATEVFAAAGSTIVNYTSGACQAPAVTPLP